MATELGAQLIYINATNAKIQTRFSETRRKHPLTKDRTVTDGIIHERQWLEPLMDASDTTIDTTDLSVHDLKRLVQAKFTMGDQPQKLSVTIMSFGFKHGVPNTAPIPLRFSKG